MKKILTIALTLLTFVLSSQDVVSTERISVINSTLAVTNDTPCTATALTNGNCRDGSTFPTTNYTTSTATTSTSGTGTVPAPNCWSSGFGETVWFSFVATTTSQKISTDVQLVGGGSNNDNQIAVYSSSNGLCSGNFTLIGCQDDICNCTGPGNNQQAEVTVNGLTIGQTYWIAIDGDGNSDGVFRICTQPAPTNDNCSSALNMTSGSVYSSSNIGASPYTGTGTGAYMSTNTGDVNFTCGSTENMVFYTFTAPTTGNYYLEQSAQTCSGSGTQVMVFKSTYTCSTLPENPMTPASSTYELVCSAASTAYRYFTMSLTAGQTYIIGVDGYAGDECSYQITIGPVLLLPVELSKFKADKFKTYNLVQWTTLSEVNNSYFEIEKSSDGMIWNIIHKESGNLNSMDIINYEYKDFNITSDNNYYRLSQTDINGSKKYFDPIYVDNSKTSKIIVKITNIIGQEVGYEYKGIIIYQYSDGTYERISQF